MGLFTKLVKLIEVDYFIWNEVENAKIVFINSELKPVEFVYLAIYQFAKVAYTVPNVSNDLLISIDYISNINKDNIPQYCTDLLNTLREINTDSDSECSKFKTQLYFKRLVERAIKTKIPFNLSQNKFLRTIPLTINLAYENTDNLEKEILKEAIQYQANLYKKGANFRSLRNCLDIPVAVFQYGLENRKLEI
jgi:hypothetical protein